MDSFSEWYMALYSFAMTLGLMLMTFSFYNLCKMCINYKYRDLLTLSTEILFLLSTVSKQFFHNNSIANIFFCGCKLINSDAAAKWSGFIADSFFLAAVHILIFTQ